VGIKAGITQARARGSLGDESVPGDAGNQRKAA